MPGMSGKGKWRVRAPEDSQDLISRDKPVLGPLSKVRTPLLNHPLFARGSVTATEKIVPLTTDETDPCLVQAVVALSVAVPSTVVFGGVVL